MLLRIMQDFIDESQRKSQVKTLLIILDARFGSVTHTIRSELEQVRGQEQFDRLVTHAATCASLQIFEDFLRKELRGASCLNSR